MNTELINAGHALLNTALQLFALSLAVAAAWACSSFIWSLICFVVLGFILSILAKLAALAATFNLSSKTLEKLGSVQVRIDSAINSVKARFVSQPAAV